MNKPFAESAQQNQQVIYEAIRPWLRGDVLEIGSGTGQHAVYFAARVPELRWQPSDLAPCLPGIEAWIEESGLANIEPPIVLDARGDWPRRRFDLVYTANTLHIIDRSAVARCIAGAGRCLRPGGVLAVYGPINYNGDYTSESNARFDAMLRARDPASGIRDFEWLDELAGAAGLECCDDIAMPVNNRSLIWKKRTL